MYVDEEQKENLDKQKHSQSQKRVYFAMIYTHFMNNVHT